jgi:hypothetical protein
MKINLARGKEQTFLKNIDYFYAIKIRSSCQSIYATVIS